MLKKQERKMLMNMPKDFMEKDARPSEDGFSVNLSRSLFRTSAHSAVLVEADFFSTARSRGISDIGMVVVVAMCENL